MRNYYEHESAQSGGNRLRSRARAIAGRVALGASLAAGMSLVAGTTTVIANPELASDAYHAASGNKTDQERTVSAGLSEAFDTTVPCTLCNG